MELPRYKNQPGRAFPPQLQHLFPRAAQLLPPLHRDRLLLGWALPTACLSSSCKFSSRGSSGSAARSPPSPSPSPAAPQVSCAAPGGGLQLHREIAMQCNAMHPPFPTPSP